LFTSLLHNLLQFALSVSYSLLAGWRGAGESAPKELQSQWSFLRQGIWHEPQ